MSLISTHNLVAPLTNKVHLMTIILVAVAFAVLRLSGGAIGTSSARPSPRANPDIQTTTIQPTPAVRQAVPPTTQTTRQGVEPWERKKDPARTTSKGKNGLNDIEKMLDMN